MKTFTTKVLAYNIERSLLAPYPKTAHLLLLREKPSQIWTSVSKIRSNDDACITTEYCHRNSTHVNGLYMHNGKNSRRSIQKSQHTNTIVGTKYTVCPAFITGHYLRDGGMRYSIPVTVSTSARWKTQVLDWLIYQVEKMVKVAVSWNGGKHRCGIGAPLFRQSDGSIIPMSIQTKQSKRKSREINDLSLIFHPDMVLPFFNIMKMTEIQSQFMKRWGHSGYVLK